MVRIKNITLGTFYTPPFGAQSISYMKQVLATTIAIPLENTPLLLNYGGDQINLTLTFITKDNTEIDTLINEFSDAGGDIYEVDLSSEWNMTFSGSLSPVGSFQGYVTQLEINQEGGQANVFTVTMNFMLGEAV